VNSLRQIGFLVRKDLRIEFRKKESLVSMAFFGILVLVTLSVAVGSGRRVSPETGAGILWVAVLFSGVLGVGRVFARERENGCVAALLVSPVRSGSVFVAKGLVNLTLMLLSQVALIPVFFALFGQGLAGGVAAVTLPLLLLDVAFASAGTLLSAVAAGTRRNEVLLPILLFPLLLPVVVLGVKASGAALAGGAVAASVRAVEPLVAFCLMYSVAGYLLFPFAAREV
jgi:heme exporter protein B